MVKAEHLKNKTKRRVKEKTKPSLILDSDEHIVVSETPVEELTMTVIMTDLFRRWISGAISYTLDNSYLFINMLYVKDLNDPNAIAACGLANTTYVIFISSITVGINGGNDTLVSQAYGKKDYKACNDYLNASRIVSILLFIPQIFLCLNADKVFLFMDQPVESSKLAATYMMVCLPGFLFFGLFENLRRYLQAHGVYQAILSVSISNCILHIILNYIFVRHLELGFIGVGISTSI